MSYGEISHIYEGSLAEEIGLVAGDKIVSVNGEKLRDIIDLSFAMAEEEIEMLIEHAHGEQELFAFDKDIDEELGVEFRSAVFDGIRRCANNCCFCFVDQIAPNMRNSLSVKDDDYRLSFLYGNFVTLTNLADADFKRIAKYHLSPLFISIQATNPELRAKLLRTPRARLLAEQLNRLDADGIEYHTQIVLCAGLNDGEELARSIRDVLARKPHAQSLAIVPVGITKHRRDTAPLDMFDAAGAAAVIDMVEPLQRQQREESGHTFIYLGDEFYFLANRELPPTEYYDGFPQLDNGIGLARNFLESWEEEERAAQLSAPAAQSKEIVHIDVLSGTAIAPMMERLAAMVAQDHVRVRILPVVNEYFGVTVNVSGLLTGEDILRTLENAGGARDILLFPESSLRAGENILLDDMSLEDIQRIYPRTRIETVQSGRDYYRALTDIENYRGRGGEQAFYTWQSNAGYTK
ncbi:DUF512 domain-containing protein [Selenomonas sp. TAMA-11512]|uniref:DUF512 domain-containing protein n=1 Tax=Selenomonas sp. TAMA-11512 TaxID=3095337 RepID=UPI003086D8B9|nr:DUF512 domain-containing protein [Selenomonas sp. TAMA-11512]